jgi:hypothetical protein
VRLLGFGHVEFALRVQGEADRAQDLLEFLELAGVVRGEDEALGHGGGGRDKAKEVFYLFVISRAGGAATADRRVGTCAHAKT